MPLKVWLLVLALLFASAPAHAASKVVAADLTDNFVGISEGFEGAKLTIFGLVKNKADAVIVIRPCRRGQGSRQNPSVRGVGERRS